MKRMTGFMMFSVLLVASAAFAQTQPNTSQVPEDAFSTRELIAWSGLQKPQPAPQPLPPRDTPIPQPDQSQDQQPTPPTGPNSDNSPAAQSFTGKIVRDSGRYSLKVGTEMYGLEGQDGLEKYTDQNVRIVGKMDPDTHTIHVLKIDLLS